MSVILTRARVDARRELGPIVRLLLDTGSAGSARYVATLRGVRAGAEARLACLDASGLAPPDGRLSWWGREHLFPR